MELSLTGCHEDLLGFFVYDMTFLNNLDLTIVFYQINGEMLVKWLKHHEHHTCFRTHLSWVKSGERKAYIKYIVSPFSSPYIPIWSISKR